MITDTSKPAFSPCEDETNITTVHYEPGLSTQGDFMRFIRGLSKWFGMLSTVAWGMAALAPDTLHISQNYRPWVFLTFIFWSFAFCAGFFNL